MKRITSFVLSFILVCSFTLPAFAAETDVFDSEVIYSKASEAVSVAAQHSIIPGQENNQIDAFYIANSIPLYEVDSNDSLVKVSTFRYYPLLDNNNNVCGMIIARLEDTDNVITVEYNTMYCDELTMFRDSLSSICFIFDQTNTYVYDGIDYTIVLQEDIPNTSRGFFNTNTREFNWLERSPIVADKQLELLSVVDPSESGIVCVPHVEQEPWENGCWAASSISAGQYLNPSVSLTMDGVMDKYAGGNDSTKLYTTIIKVLKEEYGVTAIDIPGTLRLTTVIDEIGIGIDNGKPLIGRVAYNGWFSGHFVVICGFTAVTSPGTSYVSMMDPLVGAYRTLPTSAGDRPANVLYTTPSGTTEYLITMRIIMR